MFSYKPKVKGLRALLNFLKKRRKIKQNKATFKLEKKPVQQKKEVKKIATKNAFKSPFKKNKQPVKKKPSSKKSGAKKMDSRKCAKQTKNSAKKKSAKKPVLKTLRQEV